MTVTNWDDVKIALSPEDFLAYRDEQARAYCSTYDRTTLYFSLDCSGPAEVWKLVDGAWVEQ